MALQVKSFHRTVYDIYVLIAEQSIWTIIACSKLLEDLLLFKDSFANPKSDTFAAKIINVNIKFFGDLICRKHFDNIAIE